MSNKNYLSNKTLEFKQRIGTYESQILLLNRRLYKISLHLKDHKADFSCIKGLKKLLRQRRQTFKNLMLQNHIRASESKRISNEIDGCLYKEKINDEENNPPTQVK